jgi:Ran GTPase-activating protein (RanGAP) involved in mRNA processing and transport
MNDGDRTIIKRLSANDPGVVKLKFILEDTNVKEFTHALKNNTTVVQLSLMRNYQLMKEDMDFLVDALKFNKTLVCLEFLVDITEEGMRVLTRGIKYNSIITGVGFSSCKIPGQSSRYIAELLRENKSIDTLAFIYSNITAEKIKDITIALKINTGIGVLNLWGNKLGDEGAQYLAEALKVNSSLRSITVSLNKISVIGATYIAESLKFNTALKKLNIGNNKIGAEGIVALVKALQYNRSLRHLEISATQCESSGALAVVELLKYNTSLTILEFSNNVIDFQAAVLVSQALETNQSLQRLDLSESHISSEGVKLIADGMRKNTTLSRLAFSTQKKWTDQELIYLHDALEENYRLTHLDLFRTPSVVFKSPKIEMISSFLERNQLNRMKCMALLIKAYASPHETETPVRYLCKDVLIAIFVMTFAELTPTTFKKIKHSRFFTPSEQWEKEKVMLEKSDQKTQRSVI